MLSSFCRSFLVLPVIILLAACGGGGSSPTAPSPTNQFPAVAGSYTGMTTLQLPELQQTMTCPTTTVVTQNGSTVSIAPLVLGGQCSNLSMPIGDATIGQTGTLGSETGSFDDPSCGLYSYSAGGGFFGRELRMSVSATSRTCYNFNMTINLAR